jgi:hypothetical protein
VYFSTFSEKAASLSFDLQGRIKVTARISDNKMCFFIRAIFIRIRRFLW